jgi:hypothetical protein
VKNKEATVANVAARTSDIPHTILLLPLPLFLRQRREGLNVVFFSICSLFSFSLRGKLRKAAEEEEEEEEYVVR